MSRHGFRWSIPEILQLQREYELLNMPILEIAKIHKRSECAIVAKLEKENFSISTFYNWNKHVFESDSEYISECESDSEYNSDADSEADSNSEYEYDSDYEPDVKVKNRNYNVLSAFKSPLIIAMLSFAMLCVCITSRPIITRFYGI